MPLETQRPAPIDVTKSNFIGIVYINFTDGVGNAWRLMVSPPGKRLSIQKFETLTEIGITLDDGKVTSIEGNPVYTSEDPYFASVASDTRSNNAIPMGIAGDMTGRVIEWDGFMWMNFDDQWVEKGFFEDSFFSDRGVFQRMNVIETDPNDPTRHPPQPLEGTTLGSRNTQFDGLGIELLSFNDKNGHFGQLVEFLHGPGIELINQLKCVKADSTLVGVPYELGYVAGDFYAVGDVIVDQGVRYRCNEAGVQIGGFQANLSKWDEAPFVFDVDTILTNEAGEVLVNEAGNVLVSA